MEKDFIDFKLTGYNFHLHGIEYKEFITQSKIDIFQTVDRIIIQVGDKSLSGLTSVKLYDKHARGELTLPLLDRTIKEPSSRVHRCKLLFMRHKERYVLGGEVTLRLWAWPVKCHVASLHKEN